MTARHRTVTVALVAVLLLAGCSGGVNVPRADGGTGQPQADGSTMGSTGTLAFYVSDQPTAIGDFASLTVTVTEIGVHRADTDDSGDGMEDDVNETGGNVTVQGTETAENGTQNATGTGAVEEADSDGDAGWTTYGVADATVDLTELQGDNATRIANVSLPAGEYTGVYVAVSNVTGILASGERVPVKLPSDRLRLNEGFALGTNRTTSFVFDIAVHEAGGSGKYVLRPVIGQSGADVPIRDVDEQRGGANTASRGAPENSGNPGNAGRPAVNASSAGRQTDAVNTG